MQSLLYSSAEVLGFISDFTGISVTSHNNTSGDTFIFQEAQNWHLLDKLLACLANDVNKKVWQLQQNDEVAEFIGFIEGL